MPKLKKIRLVTFVENGKMKIIDEKGVSALEKDSQVLKEHKTNSMLFNCQLARLSSCTPSPHQVRQKGVKLPPICTYHGIIPRFYKGLLSKTQPPLSSQLHLVQIPTNPSVRTVSRARTLPLRTQLDEVKKKQPKQKTHQKPP